MTVASDEACPFIKSHRAKSTSRCRTSFPPSQEFFDRIVDSFLVANLGKCQVLLLLERLLELAIKLTRPIRAFNLSVTEQVAFGEEMVAEQADAVAVVFAPVVAVGEEKDVKGVFTPRGGVGVAL